MAKTTGSDAADVVQRAPAVTVKNDRFVFVRGLSERYSSAQLNGSRLPSPDPLRRAVPLDLFPADFLDSLGVVKTFSADLPGDFSGGLIRLNLRDQPDTLTYSLGSERRREHADDRAGLPHLSRLAQRLLRVGHQVS
jgi:hypothetical protein